MAKMLTIAIPNKGRVLEPTVKMLDAIGVKPLANGDRKLIVPASRENTRFIFARAGDIPVLVATKAADIGITGQDVVAERQERNTRVEEILALDFGKCRVALAAPRRTKNPKSIATAMPNITRRFCNKEGIRAGIITLGGALESAPELRIAEAIVDQVESGDTLREHGLCVLKVIMESRMCIIANPLSLRQKRSDIDEILLCAGGLIAAKGKALVKFNVGSESVRDSLLVRIASMKSPDIIPLAQKGAYSIATVVPREGIAKLLVMIKKNGGTDILVEQPTFIIP